MKKQMRREVHEHPREPVVQRVLYQVAQYMPVSGFWSPQELHQRILDGTGEDHDMNLVELAGCVEHMRRQLWLVEPRAKEAEQMADELRHELRQLKGGEADD